MVNEIGNAPASGANASSAQNTAFAPLERSCDVCIVGGGINGMICALLLKQQGIDVHIYERQGAVYPLPRAVILSDESLSVAIKAGLGHEIKNLLKGRKGRETYFSWVDSKEEVLERLDCHSRGATGYPGFTLISQPVFEAAVGLACEAAGVPIYRHWEFTGFQKRADATNHKFDVSFKSYKGINRYNPTLNVRAKWLIGADGANSAVRKTAGIGQIDLGLCYDWLIVDCIPVDDPSLWPWLQVCDPERPTTMIGSGNRRFRWEFMRLPNESDAELCDPETVWKRMAKYGLNSSNCEIERSVVYRFRSLHAERYWDGDRVCLLGDAAHQMPPFIAQGLNSGIRDAAALAWRLGAILRDGASENIIGSYELERRGHVDVVMRKAIALGEPICQTDPEKSKAMHAVLRSNYKARNGVAEPYALELRHVEGGFYDASKYGGCLERRAGNLMPKLEGDQAFKESYGWHLVVMGTDPVSKTPQDTQKLLEILKARVSPAVDDDGDDAYLKWFGENGNARYALIRPDNYVYGFAQCADTLHAVLKHAVQGLGHCES